MAYQYDEIQSSQKIFYRLIAEGSLKEQDEPELFRAYVESEEVMNLVKSQGNIAECAVERYGSVIYLMPDMTNNCLGYSKKELKKELCKSNATDRDYYLSQFIILTLLSEFYDGQGSHSKSRDMIKLGLLQNIVSDRLKAGVQAEEQEENETLNGEYNKSGLDFHSMSIAYESLKSDEKGSRAKTTKEGLFNTIMDFLERQGLIIYIQQDEIIKTTHKLDDIMELRLLNRTNYERIMNVMEVLKNEQNKQNTNNEP